jgi:peptide/nickel transport system substrate-binding protein
MSDQSNEEPRLTIGLNSRLTRRMFLGFSAGIAALGLLAACGDDDDDDEDVAAEEPAVEDDDEEPEPEPDDDDDDVPVEVREVEVIEFDDPPPGEPVGNHPEELIIAWGVSHLDAAHGLDPQRHVHTIAENKLRHMYEPLAEFDRDLTTINPKLATSWERVDDLRMQFELREGVEFHNGEPFNAEAVRYSVLRPLSDETPGWVRDTYAIIVDVEVIDDYTVNIVTSEPDPALLARMTGFHMNMVPPVWAEQGPEVVESEAFGTGPYKFVSWRPGEDLVMEANEDYWGGAPEIKRVRCTVISEPGTRVAALLAGDVHVAKDIPPEDIDRINADDRARVLRSVSNRVVWWLIATDTDDDPLADPRVRQAVNYGANVQGVIDSILLGMGQRVSTMLAIWHEGFDPTLEPFPYDPDKARELLEDAGYPDGFDTNFWYIEGRVPKDREIAEALVLELENVGIRAEPQLREWGVYADLQAAAETPGLGFGSWGNWFFDADNTLYVQLSCEAAEARDFNHERPYGCRPEFDELISEARHELDEERRRELYAEAQRYLHEVPAALYGYQIADIFGVNNWVLWEPRHDEFMWAHEMSWNT